MYKIVCRSRRKVQCRRLKDRLSPLKNFNYIPKYPVTSSSGKLIFVSAIVTNRRVFLFSITEQHVVRGKFFPHVYSLWVRLRTRSIAVDWGEYKSHSEGRCPPSFWFRIWIIGFWKFQIVETPHVAKTVDVIFEKKKQKSGERQSSSQKVQER